MNRCVAARRSFFAFEDVEHEVDSRIEFEVVSKTFEWTDGRCEVHVGPLLVSIWGLLGVNLGSSFGVHLKSISKSDSGSSLRPRE